MYSCNYRTHLRVYGWLTVVHIAKCVAYAKSWAWKVEEWILELDSKCKGLLLQRLLDLLVSIYMYV